jgi:hypothetical protein
MASRQDLRSDRAAGISSSTVIVPVVSLIEGE